MSVLKQPFQMLPFSTSIDFQWRLRSDCFNDICDIPIIPKGKFIPFGIIANSDDVRSINLFCWDEPFSFTRTENFIKNDCQEWEVGSSVIFSKIYYSTKNLQDAKNIAMSDNNYLNEGQAYANENGICEILALFIDNFNNWQGSPSLPIPVGKSVSWQVSPHAYLSFFNDSDRLNLNISADIGYDIVGLRYVNAADFGLYAKLKVTIKVDELPEANSFVFVIYDVAGPTNSTILHNGLNEIILERGIHYDVGYKCIAIYSYSYPGVAYPRHIIIDYLQIEIYG